MRVIKWLPERNIVWINQNLDEWTVETPSASPPDNRALFYSVVTQNLLKSQLALCRASSGDFPEIPGSVQIERNERNKKKDLTFLSILEQYFLKVAPLTPQEAFVLRDVVRTYDSHGVVDAIEAVSHTGGRSFIDFLRMLDGLAKPAKLGQAGDLRPSVDKYADFLDIP